jgi:translation initiation factor 1
MLSEAKHLYILHFAQDDSEVKDDHERKLLLMPDRLVYSTDDGRVNTCPTCGKSYKQCQCHTSPSNQIPEKKTDGIARVMRDRKHRGGKTVTVITGIPASNDAITTIAQQLKKLCGSGGTVKDGVIEIQGDHCDKVQAKLTEMGYKVKRAGG